ncbi:MAG: tetratricopeptide repeat protein [Acidobacteria bacterium]|nr:tetratricopeptide repeat protein [Acidobacteriota bacterium]
MPRTILRLLFIIAVLAFAACPALAQQIQGQVRYAASQRPVIGAIVQCSGTGGISEQLSDPNGRFFFRVSPGHYDVHVRVPGYREERQSIDLLDTRSSEYMDFRLREDVPARAKITTSPGTTEAGDANVPANARAEFDKGAAAIGEAGKEKVQEGIAHLERAVSLYPNYLQAQLMLGTTYMDVQQWDKAEKTLRRAIEINPKATTATFALGEVLRREKKYDEAEKVLSEGLKLDDKSARGHFTLGEVYWEKNDIPNAGKQVGTALQLKPDYAEAHLLAGNILLRARHAEEALTEFQEYLRLAPKGEFAEQARQVSQKIKDAIAAKKK